MTALRVALSRLLDLVLRRRREARLDEEVQEHLDLLAADHQARGMSASDARVAAQRAFGNVDAMRARHRDGRGLPMLDALVQDGRFALRLMRKDPWFTAAAVITLALGIGANSTVFAITNAAMLRGLPFAEPDRVVALGTRDAREPLVRGPLGYRGISALDFEDWCNATRAFESLAAYANASLNVSDDVRAPERIAGTYIHANLFELLGERPMLGRDFRPGDDRPGAASVVILGHRVWSTRFGADPSVVGQVVRVNGVPSTIVGVMPDGFGFPLTSDAWQPLVQRAALTDEDRGARTLEAVGRLRAGVSRAQAQAELDAIAAGLAREYPTTNAYVLPALMTYSDRHLAPQLTVLFATLMGAVGCVLLIACANVANLLLARSTARARELAVRASVGASRGRIVRQLLVEALCLSIGAGSVGIAIALVAVRAFGATVEQTGAPYWLRFDVDRASLVYLAAICVGTAVLCGLSPALHLSRTSPIEVLKAGGGNGGSRAGRWSSVLVVGQVAMTLVLLAAAGFLGRAFLDLYRLDVGVDTSKLATTRLELPATGYASERERLSFYERLDKRLAALPVPTSAAVASAAFDGGRPRSFAIAGRTSAGADLPQRVAVVAIGPRYFETLGVGVQRGRAFVRSDGEPGRAQAIVNDRFAAMYLPGAEPIGHRIDLAAASTESSKQSLTIVGVTPTIGRRQQPLIYIPLQSEPPPAATLVVRSPLPLASLADALRNELRALDADLPLFATETVEQALAFARWPERVFGSIFAIFAVVGLTLSSVGLYAVVGYLVSQRRHEIGLRMALGARASQVRWLVVRRTVMQLAVGLALGLPIAAAIGLTLPWMSRDLTTLVPLVLVMITVTLTACAVPARRAARLDPMAALRHE